MLELAYIATPSGAGPLLPQSAYEAIMPFFMAVVASAFAAPFFALLVRLTISVVGEQPVAFGKAMGVGYFTSLTLCGLMIVCVWLNLGNAIWSVLAFAATTGLYSVMLKVRPQRALLLAMFLIVAIVALRFLMVLVINQTFQPFD